MKNIFKYRWKLFIIILIFVILMAVVFFGGCNYVGYNYCRSIYGFYDFFIAIILTTVFGFWFLVFGFSSKVTFNRWFKFSLSWLLLSIFFIFFIPKEGDPYFFSDGTLAYGIANINAVLFSIINIIWLILKFVISKKYKNKTKN